MDLQKTILKFCQWLYTLQQPHSYLHNKMSTPVYNYGETIEDDITSYKTTSGIFKSGRFTPAERRNEYRRRGKSPSGVIDGVYNDMYLEDGASYNDMDRDWNADA